VVTIVEGQIKAIPKDAFCSYSNLTEADHLHTFSDDEVFEYDAAHRLTKYKKGASSTQDWYLDGVYNWTKFVDYGTTETRTHNSVNEVTAIDTNNDADFLYDKNGNLTKWTDDPQGTPVVKEFYWDDLNRLTKIKVGTSGGTNDEAIFIYDVNNQRVRKEYDSDDDGDIDGNDETIEYVWSDAHVIEEYVDGSLDRSYVHGSQFIDELVLFDDGSDVYYYLQDFRYTVYAIVDDTGGTPKTTYRYDPYGKRTVVSNPGSLDDSYGFTGRYHDDSDDTDLIYFRNRWMSGEMGRFVSRDPLEYIDGYNLYVAWFVVKNIDSFGLDSSDTTWTPVTTPKGKIIGVESSKFVSCIGYAAKRPEDTAIMPATFVGPYRLSAGGTTLAQLMSHLKYKCYPKISYKKCKEKCKCDDYMMVYVFIPNEKKDTAESFMKGVESETGKPYDPYENPITHPYGSTEIAVHAYRGHPKDNSYTQKTLAEKGKAKDKVKKGFPEVYESSAWQKQQNIKTIGKYCCCKP